MKRLKKLNLERRKLFLWNHQILKSFLPPLNEDFHTHHFEFNHFSVAIRLEGGSADDLAVLEEKKESTEGGKELETKGDAEPKGNLWRYFIL